jgi:sugar (pentulose or hexulose) kinase
VCANTADAVGLAGVAPEDIAGVSFCSQMQGLVLVDTDGRPVVDLVGLSLSGDQREALGARYHGLSW